MAIATPLNPDQPILPPDTDASEGDEGEGLVEYEGMLVSASAAQRRRCFADSYILLLCHAQRRRCCAHSYIVLMKERQKRLHLLMHQFNGSQVLYRAAQGRTDVSCLVRSLHFYKPLLFC